ncbi:MAG: PAS domain S-box protein [Bacteroidales bacterium]|nr:PAS domain S-box protein [Bacteroidales bacterium]
MQNGEYIWILDMGKVIERDEKGNPLRIIGVSLDISKRKETEQNLKNKEERYRSIYEHLTDGFCRFNFGGTILEVNEILASLIKLPSEQMIGKNIRDFLPAKTAKTLMKLAKSILKTHSLTTETEIITYNNKKLTVSLSAKLISQNNHKIIQALIRDITMLKNLNVFW